MSLKVIWIYICDHCGAEKQESFGQYWDNALTKPCLPENWWKMGETIYCDKHKLKLIVDNEVVFE